MTDKKDAAVTVHMPSNRKTKIARLADHQGITSSEWFDRLAEKELKRIQDEVDFIKSVFSND